MSEAGTSTPSGTAGSEAATWSAVVESVHARAALAGNPSDGYGGAVFAIPVPAYEATATITRITSGWELIDELSGSVRYETWAGVERAMLSATADSPHSLVLATLAAVVGRNGTPPAFRLTVNTSIPVSVGLAGSSAIVIAALRALMRLVDDAVSADELAMLAWSIETERLGIAAGLQDRIVQVYGRPMLMRFDASSGENVLDDSANAWGTVDPGGDLRLFVAHRAGLSEPSQLVHGELRERHARGDAAVLSAMRGLAGLAGRAAKAYEAGDVAALGGAMDATFELRASMIDLHPGHVEMIEAARAAGASANYTGSGGAIVVLSPGADADGAARQSLKRLGCEIVSVSSVVSMPVERSTSDSSDSSD